MGEFIFLGGSEMHPASWAECRNALEQAGHHTRTLDWVKAPWHQGLLPALDFLAQPLQGLSDVILVGHSAAGLFLPSLAKKIQAQAEIHLASLVTKDGESFLDRVFADEEIFTPEWESAYPKILSARGTPEKLRAIIEPFLFHDCPPGSFAHWRPSPTLDLLYGMRFPAVENPARHGHYLICRADRTIRPEWQRQAAAEILRTKSEPREFPTGHCPHLAKPKELAELLAKLATAHG